MIPDESKALVRRIQAALREVVADLGRLNDAVGGRLSLRPGDVDLIDWIGRHGPVSPTDLAAAAGIHPATLTGILDRLEQARFIERAPHPDDRRRIHVEAVRERGGELARLYRPMNQALQALCDAYTADQLRLIAGFLERVAGEGEEATSTLRSEL
jgi:DNA-binding MarR family transcriptional regulator